MSVALTAPHVREAIAKRFASVEMMATDGQVKWIVKKGDQVFGPFETKEEALKLELGLEADD